MSINKSKNIVLRGHGGSLIYWSSTDYLLSPKAADIDQIYNPKPEQVGNISIFSSFFFLSKIYLCRAKDRYNDFVVVSLIYSEVYFFDTSIVPKVRVSI